MSQLALNQIRAHPDLVRAAPAAAEWIKDGGATLPGTVGYWERWSKSQWGRSGVHNPNLEYCCVSRMHKNGEVCSHVYVMLLLEKIFDLSAREAWCFDVVERILYNAYFAAQSKEARPEWQGTKQRYDTAVEGPRVWFNMQTYCCPGNFRKYMFGIPRLVYKQRPDGIYINLYEASRAELRLKDTRVRIVQNTLYPHDGKVVFQIDPDNPVPAAVHFRIPAWCRTPSLTVNGQEIAGIKTNAYARVERRWRKGDVVELNLPMGWDWIAGFREQAGRAGLMRGPLVYCLNPVRNRLPGYRDLAFAPQEYAQGIKYGADQGAYAAYENSYRKLRDLVLDPATVSAPMPDATVQPNGNAARVRAWSSRDMVGGAPEQELVLTEFPDEEGRATFFLLNDQRVMRSDPLFACELKETSLFQQKWEHEKKRLDASKLATLPWRPSRDDLLVPALRGSNLELTAEGELAGHRAWMSVTELPTPSRRMGFRLPDDRYLDQHPSRVRFTILYLDRGDCKVELFYDSIDSQWQVLKSRPEVIAATRRPFVASSRGAFKSAGAFRVGDSGEWRQVSFEVSDARLATQSDGKDLLLKVDRDTNFIVQGVYFQELAGGRRETNLKIPKID